MDYYILVGDWSRESTAKRDYYKLGYLINGLMEFISLTTPKGDSQLDSHLATLIFLPFFNQISL